MQAHIVAGASSSRLGFWGSSLVSEAGRKDSQAVPGNQPSFVAPLCRPSLSPLFVVPLYRPSLSPLFIAPLYRLPTPTGLEGRVTRARQRLVSVMRTFSTVAGVPREEGRCSTNRETHVRITPPSSTSNLPDWRGVSPPLEGRVIRARQRLVSVMRTLSTVDGVV